MKKIIAVILCLSLALTAFTAFADDEVSFSGSLFVYASDNEGLLWDVEPMIEGNVLYVVLPTGGYKSFFCYVHVK